MHHLDHRLTPETRAMFASMASRNPDGGIYAKYSAVVAELERAGETEERLTTYPLHPIVQRFFDEYVGQYGHSSIQENTGDPAVYIENVSWSTMWWLFDSPLVKGQEFSTRARRIENWPMARECNYLPAECYAELQAQHANWLEVYSAEVEWWKEHLSEKENRKKYGIADKEPFRPAFDRARWALPGSIATGGCFTSDIRERSRTIWAARQMENLPVWEEIIEGYNKALPGLAPIAFDKLRHKAYAKKYETVSAHACSFLYLDPSYHYPPSWAKLTLTGESFHRNRIGIDIIQDAMDAHNYVSAWLNHEYRVTVDFVCSIAAARDWHRHRTFYPWGITLPGQIKLYDAYQPQSEFAKRVVPLLLNEVTRLHSVWSNLLESIALRSLLYPLGTEVVLFASGGLQHAIYMLQLRQNAHGSNFEYREQAATLYRSLLDQMVNLNLIDKQE